MADSDSRYAVKDYSPDKKESLRALCAEVWPNQPAGVFDRRWWWSSSTPPIKLVADAATGKLAGFCAYIPFAAHFGSRTRSSAWLVDFFVAPGHQGKGLGRLLTASVSESFELTASLNQNDAAYAVFRKMGWRPRRTAKLYLNPWTLAAGAFRPFFGAPIDPRLTISAAPFSSDRIGPEFDRLWNTAKERFGAMCVRDARALRERYGQPGTPYTLLRCEENGALAGYMVTRRLPRGAVRSLRGLPAGLIVDYLTAPEASPRIFSALAADAARRLAGEGPAVLLALSSVPEFGRALAALGFAHSGTPLIGGILARLDVGFTLAGRSGDDEILDAPWFLTLGDCDMDLMW